MPAPGQYLIAIAVYDGVDLLDVSVPYQPFNCMAPVESQHDPATSPRPVQLNSLDGPAIATGDGMTIVSVLKRTAPS
ncbi:hypothetical protein CP336_21730 [Pseudomonas fluorescens]|jgi:cyclohexyl-isocyanide hydratase|nr:hypothetical protein CP336_21730 [Pseudomonas fluorescens]